MSDLCLQWLQFCSFVDSLFHHIKLSAVLKESQRKFCCFIQNIMEVVQHLFVFLAFLLIGLPLFSVIYVFSIQYSYAACLILFCKPDITIDWLECSLLHQTVTKCCCIVSKTILYSVHLSTIS